VKKVKMKVEGVRGVQEGTKPVGFWEAFWFWVKLGFINFGGRRVRSLSCTGSWLRRSVGFRRANT
jgi:hypothetical protein